ncbi:MAG: acyltransferase family protein [Solirubrobacteraceae bacterium]
MATAAPAHPPRLRALDGLRGLGAMLVVVSHMVVATNAALASQFFDDAQPLTGGDWLFAETPLHILWADQEWVIMFFVLSGLVLSLAVADGERFDAARYYPTRLVRLYVPVWASLVLAGLLHEAVAHEHIAGATEWLDLHVTDWSASATAKEIVLLLGAGDYYYSTVLWTLRWEVAYSLALPLFLLCARRLPWSLVAAASLLAVVVAGPEFDVLRFIVAFMLGTLLAFRRERVTAALADNRVYALALAASPILLTASHWLPGGRWHGPALGMVTLGALGLVATAMAPGPFARWLRTPPMQFVGRRSFSLYLIHEPIIVAAAFALGGRPSLPLLAACALPPIALTTLLFYRVVERPAQRLGYRLGDANAERVHGAPRAASAET